MEKNNGLVLICFNRPDLLEKQVHLLKKHWNGTVYVIVDGPRANNHNDVQMVAQVCKIIDSLKSTHMVFDNRSQENLGCYYRIKTGLDWVFSLTDRAIILEDDCIPDKSFFVFCDDMLDRYASNQSIFSISGTNLFPEIYQGKDSYFFTRYHNCWGWATWSRAWDYFIDSEDEWLKVRDSHKFKSLFLNLRSFLYWRKIFDLTYNGKINSWAYRWMLTCWMNQGLSIHCKYNLITNLGDGESATRTRGSNQTRRPLQRLVGEIIHPTAVQIFSPYDKMFEDTYFSKTLANRLRWLLSRLMRR